MSIQNPLPAATAPAGFADVLARRAAINHFDPSVELADAEIVQLASMAMTAPSAFNLQNWRLHAVRSVALKAELCDAAWGQPKVRDASATFVASGVMADGDAVQARLQPAVDSGLMTSGLALSWADMARNLYSDRQASRDEAIRSATFLACTLMLAAETRGWATAPMSGFDANRVQRLLQLPDGTFPVLLLAVGKPLSGNWPQKPRQPIERILSIA